MGQLVINPGNTMIAEIQARSSVSRLFVNGGSGSITIRNKATGAVIAGPLAMAYVSNSAGLYRAEIPASAPFVVGTIYEAALSLSQGSSQANWVEDITAVQRT